MDMNIIEHIEKSLGKISRGWMDNGTANGLQVVSFQHSPFEHVDAFMTIGLSQHELNISERKKVRQELIWPVSDANLSDLIVSCLFFICELIIKNHSPLLRGQVIRLPKEVVDRLGFDAIYCAIPVFLDDEFATFNGSQPPTVIVWLMPIYKSEANFVDENGWDKFEDILEEKGADLFSLRRAPLI
jgi:hypothetical protein